MQTATVRIGTKQWSVDVATTAAEITQGLGGVASIPANTGMLFDLGSARIVTVNAYEMLFPLSIVFIGSDLKVTEVALLLAPGGDGTTSLPCRYFLEVNEGEVGGIQQGNEVMITGYPATTTGIDMNSMLSMMITMMVVVMMMQMMTKTMKEVK